MKTAILAVIFLTVLALYTATTMACSTCMVGDPTMTLMGTEKPYEGRLRVATDVFTREEKIGRSGFNERTISESQLGVNLAYAPGTRYMIGVRLPYVRKELEDFNLAREKADAAGDITVTVKNFLQSHTMFQRHMYGLLAGVRLPTASEQKLPDGTPVDFDAQPGVGAAVIHGGAWYGYYAFPLFGYASATWHTMTGEGFQGFRAGDALVSTLGIQYANDAHIAWQLGLETRWSEQDTYFDATDPNSGGFIGFLVPGLVYTITTDLLFNTNVKLPAIDNLTGDHEEGAVFTLGLTYDF